MIWYKLRGISLIYHELPLHYKIPSIHPFSTVYAIPVRLWYIFGPSAISCQLSYVNRYLNLCLCCTVFSHFGRTDSLCSQPVSRGCVTCQPGSITYVSPKHCDTKHLYRWPLRSAYTPRSNSARTMSVAFIPVWSSWHLPATPAHTTAPQVCLHASCPQLVSDLFLSAFTSDAFMSYMYFNCPCAIYILWLVTAI